MSMNPFYTISGLTLMKHPTTGAGWLEFPVQAFVRGIEVNPPGRKQTPRVILTLADGMGDEFPGIPIAVFQNESPFQIGDYVAFDAVKLGSFRGSIELKVTVDSTWKLLKAVEPVVPSLPARAAAQGADARSLPGAGAQGKFHHPTSVTPMRPNAEVTAERGREVRRETAAAGAPPAAVAIKPTDREIEHSMELAIKILIHKADGGAVHVASLTEDLVDVGEHILAARRKLNRTSV